MCQVAHSLSVRVLLVAPTTRPEVRRATRTVCFHRSAVADPTTAVPLVATERQVAPESVVATALDLLEHGGGDPCTTRDVIVCAHGKRDACCGGSGTILAAALAAGAGDGIRVWRSSHQGGHRFAPTLLVLPDATSWANLDESTAVGIVSRRLEPAEVIDHFRGSSSFGCSELQAVDGVALAASGWAWLDSVRCGELLGPHRWSVTGSSNGSPLGRAEAVVEIANTYEVPPCGASMDEPIGEMAHFDALRLHAYRYDTPSTLDAAG